MAICNDQRPEEQRYEQHKMRDHLKMCFEMVTLFVGHASQYLPGTSTTCTALRRRDPYSPRPTIALPVYHRVYSTHAATVFSAYRNANAGVPIFTRGSPFYYENGDRGSPSPPSPYYRDTGNHIIRGRAAINFDLSHILLTKVVSSLLAIVGYCRRLPSRIPGISERR